MIQKIKKKKKKRKEKYQNGQKPIWDDWEINLRGGCGQFFGGWGEYLVGYDCIKFGLLYRECLYVLLKIEQVQQVLLPIRTEGYDLNT